MFKMPKISKIQTPDWIKEGYDSPEEYEKSKGGKSVIKKPTGKVYKIKKCPKCGSNNVGVVLSNSDSEEGGGKEWECRKCKWEGKNVKDEVVSEDEFIELIEEKEE
jgi:hypothetical protein